MVKKIYSKLKKVVLKFYFLYYKNSSFFYEKKSCLKKVNFLFFNKNLGIKKIELSLFLHSFKKK
jgi:hypothetical protein